MRTLITLFFIIAITNNVIAQNISELIKISDVERIEKTLSSNEMQGRRVFTEGIEKAANFIANEFAKSKLQFFGSSETYKQTFTMVKPKFISVSASINEKEIDAKNLLAKQVPDYEGMIIANKGVFS